MNIFLREDYNEHGQYFLCEMGVGFALTALRRWSTDLSPPFLSNSFCVATYFKYSIMWLESTMTSGTTPEVMAPIAQC